jgi:hypothetical protein
MRKILILGSALALAGFAAAAQASDRSHANDRDDIQIQRQASKDASNDARGERHDRSERSRERHDRYERSRERHDESRERHRESREMHDSSDDRDDRR